MILNKSNIFSNKNFTVFWLSNLIAAIGDQLTLIALPWLALKLTNSVVAVGMILAIMSIPRAIFIVLGGALTDKFRPKNILIVTKISSFSVLLTLAALIWFNAINLSILYVLVALLGLTSALAIPAMMSMLPTILKLEQLKSGNGITLATMQLSAVLSPVLAGYVIAMNSGATDSVHSFTDAFGLSIVFLADAISFFISGLILLIVKLPTTMKQKKQTISLLFSIVSAFNYMKQDKSLYFYLIYIAVVSFFIIGPASVAIPILVKIKFLGDATDFGLLMTMQGAGMTVGIFLATLLPMIRKQFLGMSIMILDFIAGVCVSIFAHIVDISLAYSLLFIIGTISGFVQITAFTWIQMRTKSEYVGRMMSFLTFASLGLAPISSALAGYFIAITSVTIMFTLVGVMVMILALFGLSNPAIRRMGMQY